MADRCAWSGGRREECVKFLHRELDRALSQRRTLEKYWRKWLELYRAPGNKAVAQFPFPGASARTYPLAAMNVDPIWARYMQNIHAPANLWTITPLNERWVDVAKPLQDYLQFLDRHILKMWDVNMRVFSEMLKLGTSIYKTHWRYEQRRKVGYDQFKQRTRILETVNQPTCDHVSIANFLLPPEAKEIDPDAQGGARWVAERHMLLPNQLQALARGQEPFLPNLDSAAVKEVLKWQEVSLTEHDQKILEMDKLDDSVALTFGRPIEIWEIHVRWDTTGNGVDDDLVILWHQPSHTILRATYEPMGYRPYTAIRYLRGDGFFGIGICEQMEMWQSTMSDVMNYDIDKLLLTNAPMIRARDGANILPNEPFFPGKVLFGDKDEYEPFFLTDNRGNMDMLGLLNFLMEGGKQRSGITDLQFGTISGLPSRTPATTVQSLLQEGNTRFDMSMKDARIALGEVGLRVLQNLQTQANDYVNNPEGEDYIRLAAMVLGEPEGQFVAQALMVPFQSIELGVGVQLTATSGANNKELLRQSNLALLQLYAQLGPAFIQLAQLVGQDPGGPVGATALQLFNGGRELMERVLEQFDVRNPEEIVPNVQALLQAQAQLGGGGGQIAPLAVNQAGAAPAGLGGF